jgi:uncharacterized protein (DUF2164 family)
MTIELSPETTKQLQASIKRYFAENLDQDIGDLKAGMLLNYCLKEIGPSIYNQAIADAQAYFQARVGDLEAVCYEKEFTYWTPKPTDRGGKPRTKGSGLTSA